MRRVIYLTLFVFITLDAFAQNVSNEGRSFFLTFPTHDPSNGNLANIRVFVTSKEATTATLTCGTYTQTLNIPANTATPFNDVPRANAYVALSEGNSVLTNRAIRVTVPANKPKVAVYAHIFAGARSAATLVLPFESLGQTYYSMNYTQAGGSSGFTTLIAAEDNTTLLLHEKSGDVRTITLPRAGDLYQYTPGNNADNTGVMIEVDKTTSACKRFAVFSGSTSLYIGCNTSMDPLFQQLYATTSWGKEFGIVPFSKRRYILRVLAKDPNTTVNINGSIIQLINSGAYYESPVMYLPSFVSADKPISVAQFSLTQTCSSATDELQVGDPEMVLLNPVEFGIKNITMFSSTLQAITERYINVFIKSSGVASFKINGAPVNTAFSPFPANPAFFYAQIYAENNSLTLSSNETFNAIAYGFGNVESYAYSAGTSLAANQFLMVKNVSTGIETSEACESQTYELKITIPTQANKLIWKFNDGSPDYIDTAPVGTVSVNNEQTFYTYQLPIDKTYTTPGVQPVQVIASSPNTSSGCSIGETEYNFEVIVNAMPASKFSVAAASCVDRDTYFKDETPVTNNTVITEWQWDFGDGETSKEQNPVHRYTTYGTYNVKLVTKTMGGCYSDPFILQVHVSPTPIAAFTGVQNSCTNTNITFTDQSTIPSGYTLTKWHWDFGDGNIEDKTTNTPVVHQYTAVGSYKVRLTVESNTGCVSDVIEKQIEITVLPVVAFKLPDVCLTDAMAIFENDSKDVDGTTTALTYLWNFGDPGSGALNTSAAALGQHKYMATGDFNVTLTITNANGCVNTLTRTLTVNGAFPVASFEVQNVSALCGNEAVMVKNTSTVDAGKITRLEWYFDDVNHPADVVVDEEPEPGKIYSFNYPVFSTPLSRTITIRLVAFSGGICSNSTTQTITLKASPNVVFEALPAICMSDGKIQLTQASETGQSIGKGTYSGTGITPEGLFDPVVAGPGQHTITYTFLNDNGCKDVKSQEITVNENPQVDAGADLFILEGGELPTNSKATGSNLTYKWTPATGLSRDDVLNPIVRPASDMDYTLTVTNDKGCVTVDKLHVTFLDKIVPLNSFSPNGDGVNDVWTIKYIDSYPKATVEVLNRYGDRVFFSNGYAVPFDGKYKNLSLPVGTYYYIITPGNGRKPVTGSLTLIR